jgi:hypothetical protein
MRFMGIALSALVLGRERCNGSTRIRLIYWVQWDSGAWLGWDGFSRTFLADYLRVSLLFNVAGLLGIAWWPQYRVGSLHTVFIIGFNLIVFTVATRVVLGHSGNLDRLKTRLWLFILMSALLFLAMVSRVTDDLSPRPRIIHLLAAALLWLAASVIWMIKVIPKVAIAEEE